MNLMRHADIRTTMNGYGDSFMDNLSDTAGEVSKMLIR